MTLLIYKINYIYLSKVFLLMALLMLVACQNTPPFFSITEPPIENIQTTEFEIKQSEDVIGQVAAIYSMEGEVLPDIARHYGLGYKQIARANQNLDIWQLEANSKVILPLQFVLPKLEREGIVINLANMRMFYFPNKERSRVMTFPLGIGKEGWSTPAGKTQIVSKVKAPKWYVPKSIRREHAAKGDPLPAVVLAGPDNPLGNFAMRLGIPSYLIHGTNKPYGVGLRVSHGCVRMYPENIERLFHQVSVGVSVNIVDQPYLVGWKNQILYLEAHELPPSQQKNQKQLLKKVQQLLKKNIEKTGKIIDWDKVEKVLSESTGIPQPILLNDSDVNTLAIVKRTQRLNHMPIVPPLLQGDWSVEVAEYMVKENADKLTAILNHQSPQIPSRVLHKDRTYQVIAGPFIDKKQAKKVIQQINREFEIKAKLRVIE